MQARIFLDQNVSRVKHIVYDSAAEIVNQTQKYIDVDTTDKDWEELAYELISNKIKYDILDD